ncbi:unnamed protein product [Phytomonas sp. Hart1]|nr:unnamed protein product [Phytomonas sp. Hart1]|eukprot:CCW68589.1 unnamed protein product [Phytomonas sp. isolate Hart1]
MVELIYHFVTLQHGYYGTAKDLSYFVELLRRETSSSNTFVILEPTVNSWNRTGDGIMECGERVANYVMKRVEDALAPLDPTEIEVGTSSVTEDKGEGVSCGGRSTRTASTAHLHFSFVAHSMGGLIIRAALPLLAASLRKRYDCRFPFEVPGADSFIKGNDPHKSFVEVYWETFCTIAAPHVGVAQMPSRLKRWVVDQFVPLSSTLRDMFLVSDTLIDILLQDPYLDIWKAFKRRILVGVLGDQTVMAYSSVFCVLPTDQGSLRVHSQIGKEEDPSNHSSRDSAAAMLPVVSTREELPSALTSTLRELTPERWPVDILPRERDIAARIIERVGPFEHCLVDFQARLVKHFKGGGFWSRLGARRFGHRAVICKYPCNNREIFGFLCEHIAEDVLIQAVEQACPSDELTLAA